ncbi:hypothetical protein DDE82_001907 [Stemphylium lycopersici]|nr:hypothetical protein TW65_07255 [Stemphylium lycopersici]RAR08999.1 hypothetical protein DDE82_001907 [Stemphylium lycopersici]
MAPPSRLSVARERPLRIATLFTSAFATPFLIASTILSLQSGYWYRSDVTAFCFGYIPLFMTAVASSISLITQRRHSRLPGAQFSLLDGLAAVTYLSILISIWAAEVVRMGDGGEGLVAGYTTAPMIVNMFVHAYIFGCNARTLWASRSSVQVHECPNCHNSFAVGAQPAKETTKGGDRYSLLRGEDYLYNDADEGCYIDASARSSEEQMRPECEAKEEGKDKKILEV